ncbi:hypothetical protein PCASD_11366 [Puccinia coronata f. sp. avenae]|uniref:Uncharacterized protein n=1 Tax=Puccinia coronata f. sp. avenae TaxID=200324 RepID=A0A2N5UFT9_9BASI|nr:hypothetical protein PCASD_11366 [Puccinia coronata f. sp. avenae]
MRRNHVHRLIPKRATPAPSGVTTRRPRRQESPRIPVQLPSPSRLKAISLSPLIDPQSPLSLPESDHQRLKWLNRFTPHWNESKKERRDRFQLRTQKMRTRRAHTEKMLNSFQRLDGFTGTVLPSDLMISFSFSKWTPPPQDAPQSEQPQPPVKPAKKSKNVREDGPGAYLTPNRILHPYWVSKKTGMSVWLLCHQDILKHRKKLRTLYRYTQEPKFSPHLADQVSSQLARRIAQECVVLKNTLGPPTPCTPTSLDELVSKNTSASLVRIPDHHPTSSSGPALVSYLESLLRRPSELIEANDSGKVGDGPVPDPSASLGAILANSTNLFHQLAQLQPSQGASSEQTSDEEGPTMSPDRIQDRLMFSLNLSDGPVPIWNLEGLLNRMAKQPPRQSSSGSMLTAALDSSPCVSEQRTLAEILRCQIEEALSFSPSSTRAPAEAYLIPLNEPSYALILALRRATWWLGQGFEPDHFAQIAAMVSEAEGRKSDKEAQWLGWVRSRNVVEGKIKRKGQLWIPFEPRSGPRRQLWRRV